MIPNIGNLIPAWFKVLMFLNVSVYTASAQFAPSGPAQSNDEKRLYLTLAREAQQANLENTKRVGGVLGDSFAETYPQGGILVGFDVWEGVYNAGVPLVIRGICPIFQTATGRVRGQNHGSTRGKPTMTVEAKPGYAVAALEARGGNVLDGFQVLFWKVNTFDARLDAEGTYKSAWIGGSGGEKARHPLSSDGRAVIGVTGEGKSFISRIGLLYGDQR